MALAIDTLTKADGISNEPPNKVPTQPTTPETSPITPRITETSPSTSIPSTPTSASTSTASTGPSEVPSDIGLVPSDAAVVDYIAPILKGRTTMTALRQKIGHEKGKEWTHRLNLMVDEIVTLVNKRTPSKDIMRILATSHSISLGPLVTSIRVLPRNKDGVLVKGWEEADLCSNLKARGKPKSPPNDEPNKNLGEGEENRSTSVGKGEENLGTSNSNQVVADDAPITSRSAVNWLPINPNDPDDIAKCMEMVAFRYG